MFEEVVILFFGRIRIVVGGRVVKVVVSRRILLYGEELVVWSILCGCWKGRKVEGELRWGGRGYEIVRECVYGDGGGRGGWLGFGVGLIDLRG